MTIYEFLDILDGRGIIVTDAGLIEEYLEEFFDNISLDSSIIFVKDNDIPNKEIGE